MIHSMKSLTQASWLSVWLTVTLTWLSLKASAQSGFLSVDCGAPAAYVETGKGISWVPDDAYISGGMTASVTNVSDPKWNSHLLNLRYFPDTARTRYCYSLPTTMGKNYLLRAIFFHGGYDNSPVVKFDAALDLFDTRITVDFNVQYNLNILEYIFRAFRMNIQFCLFRISPTDNPFISSLELRPLDDTMYPAVAGGSALYNEYRLDFGPFTAGITRYPDDPYDRFWYSPGSSTGTRRITANPSVQYTGYALDKAPSAVMNTAMTLATGYGPSFWWTFTPSFPKNPFVINVFFAELESFSAQSRTFDILVNGVVWVPNVNVYTIARNSLYMPIEFSTNSSIVDAQGNVKVTLSPTASSVDPPIWNAVEFYSVQNKQAGTLASDVSAIEGLKTAFRRLGALWTGDPCLIIPYDWLTCSIASPPRVTDVKLSSAGLAGPIPDLSALTSLTTLHLDNNKLTGAIPDWLTSLPNLKELYLQNNNLKGDVPKALLNLPVIRLEGNSGLCVNTTCPTKGNSSVIIIVGISVGAFVGIGIVIAIVVVLCCCCKKVEDANGTPPFPTIVKEEGPVSRGLIDEGISRGSRYTLAQVMTATKNNTKMLGRGGFGPVYYGKLTSGQEVAVKVSAKGSNQGSKEFINEVELLTRVHHKNLVSLVGYCDQGENLILLYEYMQKGTVQEHLYGVGAQRQNSFLDWKTRLQIALNSAQGLEYLHVGCNPIIFHRDVKSNNILLNDKLIAKVADFGLSKSTDLNENVTHMSTMVKGTIGYLDPEYYMSNQLTDKSDVYSFGIVLLELICARPPFVPQLPKEQQLLDKWVRPHLQNGTIEEIVDPALAGQYNLDAMWKVADLAMQSVEPKGMHRPTMSTIVHELRAVLEIENCSSTPCTRPPSQGSFSGFRFDMIQSSSSVSDPQFGSNTTVQAR